MDSGSSGTVGGAKRPGARCRGAALLGGQSPGSARSIRGRTPPRHTSGQPLARPEARRANSPPVKASESAKRLAQFEKDLLPQAQELLGKVYQNHLFGGISPNALLWQE